MRSFGASGVDGRVLNASAVYGWLGKEKHGNVPP